MNIKDYIQNLFDYLDKYESSTSQFETEAFLQTYNGILAVFNSLRQQRSEAVAVDEYFLDRIQRSPLTSSDLRQLTVQVLITFYESEADTDGQSNRAYSYCRGLRAVKQDIPFFEQHLVPLICEEGSLNLNFRLKEFLLGEIARYMTRFGRPLQQEIKPETFQALSVPIQLLELTRRRSELGHTLAKDRTSLEFHLQQVDYFEKSALKGQVYEHSYKSWEYLQSATFWTKTKSALSNLVSGITGAFASSGYFRLVINQRRPAYWFYATLIVALLFVAIYVPLKWQSYGEQQLEGFQQRSQTTGQTGGR
jgi:hypothetical protein